MARGELIFACVKWGDRYGPEYVNILRDMISRNLAEGVEGQFWCLTDNPQGLDSSVTTVPLPAGPEGWWSKLAMFAPGAFPEGARVIYFDLDTVIGGRLDDLLTFDGDFAILRDFYRPNGYGSGVMAWRGGWGAHIWESWIAAGRPELPGGDQAWIELVQPSSPRLQDLFPGLFCSFKRDCNPRPPRGAYVICFHGEPKPHNCGSSWVADLWKVGGAMGFHLDMICNTEDERLRKNVESACKRSLPWLDIMPAMTDRRQAILVGGGPSVKRFLPEIRRAVEDHNADVFALNGAMKMLSEAFIPAWYQVITDPRASSAKFAAYQRGPVQTLIASHCDPITFDVAEAAGRNVKVYHPNNGIVPPADLLPWPSFVPHRGFEEGDRPVHLVGGGSTVGLQAMVIAYLMGYRVLRLYGYDSSYEGTEGHAYAQPENDGDRIIEATLAGRTFRAAPWMIAQANEFQDTAHALRESDCEIIVHGDGLLPHMARLLSGVPLQSVA